MSMDLTGITNKNEYFTNHYFSTVFEENASTTISGWNAEARESLKKAVLPGRFCARTQDSIIRHTISLSVLL